MGMKQVKTLVDGFTTHTTQDGDMTIGEVIREGKILCSIVMGEDTDVMYSYSGSPKNRKGEFKTAGRTRHWSKAGIKFQVELDRALYYSISTALQEMAEASF